MIKQAKRLGRAVKRVGCTPYKVLYSIKLEDLRLFGVKDAAIISICFERGGKLASSTDYTVLGKLDCLTYFFLFVYYCS